MKMFIDVQQYLPGPLEGCNNVTNEAFSRVKIDAQRRDQGWEVENPTAVPFGRGASGSGL